jgi:hypothetical protein
VKQLTPLAVPLLLEAPRGAHLLLQIRTRVLNDQLADDFHRWYPNFSRAPDPAVLAA